MTVTFTALKAQKTRSLLASLGIMIGIGSVIIMVAIGRGSLFSLILSPERAPESKDPKVWDGLL